MISSRTHGLLFVSFALNALLLGTLLGGASYYYAGYTVPSLFGYADNSPYESISTLSSEKRVVIETALNTIRKDMETIHKQMDKLRNEGFQLLKKDPFDEKAFMAQQHRMHEQHAVLRTEINRKISATAKELTAQERSIFVDILSRPPFSPPHGPLPVK